MSGVICHASCVKHMSGVSCHMYEEEKIVILIKILYTKKNKTAAQAAGADPSR